MNTKLFLLIFILTVISCQKKVEVNNIPELSNSKTDSTTQVKIYNEDEKLFLDFYYGMSVEEVYRTIRKLKLKEISLPPYISTEYILNLGKNEYIGQLDLIETFDDRLPNFNKLERISITFSCQDYRVTGKFLDEDWKLSDSVIRDLIKTSLIKYDEIFQLYVRKYGNPNISLDKEDYNEMDSWYIQLRETLGEIYKLPKKYLTVYNFEDNKRVISFSSARFGVPRVRYNLKSTRVATKKRIKEEKEKEENIKKRLNKKTVTEI